MTTVKPTTEDVATILSVDDEPLNNELVKRTFRSRANRRVLSASSGDEALQILASTKVDVVLCDYSMPGMNGVQFLEKAKGTTPSAVVMMVTAFIDLRDVTDAQLRGLVRHILAKPWLPADLIEATERALSLRDLTSAVSRLQSRGPGKPNE